MQKMFATRGSCAYSGPGVTAVKEIRMRTKENSILNSYTEEWAPILTSLMAEWLTSLTAEWHQD